MVKKNPLNVAILVCLIIIIILLILLLIPGDDKKVSHKDSVKSEEKVDSNKSEGDDTDNSSVPSTKHSLFTDTSQASNEEEVVSYVEEVEDEVSTLVNSDSNDKSVKEKLEDTFITLTDFIFYNGTIKGVTFQELTDNAKEKVLTLYENIDNTIEERFPNYKENIKSTAERGYVTVVEKASELKDSIVNKYKEYVGEEEYNNTVNSYNEDKDRFKDAYTPYVEKGKEIAGVVGDKAQDIWSNVKEKADSWYQEFKESRE